MVPTIPIERRLQQEPILKKKPYQHVSPKELGKGRKDREDGEEENDPKPVATGSGIAFFVVEGKEEKVGVFKMTEFAAPSEDWASAMKKGFKALKEADCKRVILDLAGNGGGVICTAYALLRLFPPASGQLKPFYTDIRLGGKLRDVAAKAVESENNILNPVHWLGDESGKSMSGKDLIDPMRYKDLPGGKKSEVSYTALFRDSCDDFSWGGDVKEIFTWGYKDVAFYTDGMCGSSCSLVHNHIHEQTPDIRSVVITPAPATATVTASTLPGGMVYRASYLSSDIEDVGMTRQMDVTLPVQGDVYFAFREAYSRNEPSKVLEYKRTPADARIPYTAQNAVDVKQQWLDVADKMWPNNGDGEKRGRKRKQ